MLVNNMEEMEKIVSKNSNLSWDGWNVVHLKQDDYAEFSSNGFFDKISGRWYRKNIYSCGNDGWEIPDVAMS